MGGVKKTPEEAAAIVDEMLRRLFAACPEGQEASGFILGKVPYRIPALRRAIDARGLPYIKCGPYRCPDPWHVTLLCRGPSGRSQWTLTVPEDDPADAG